MPRGFSKKSMLKAGTEWCHTQIQHISENVEKKTFDRSNILYIKLFGELKGKLFHKTYSSCNMRLRKSI